LFQIVVNSIDMRNAAGSQSIRMRTAGFELRS
jgi:hypothetical protein